jgi:hypothetical protein
MEWLTSHPTDFMLVEVLRADCVTALFPLRPVGGRRQKPLLAVMLQPHVSHYFSGCGTYLCWLRPCLLPFRAC